MTAELLMDKTGSRGRVRSDRTHISTGNTVQDIHACVMPSHRHNGAV